MKKIIYGMGMFAAVMMLSGCGDAIPEMTEAERSMVVNYAADAVQRYNKNNPSRLQNVNLLYEEASKDMAAGSEPETVQESKEEDSSLSMEKPEIIDNTESMEAAPKESTDAPTDAPPEATLNNFLNMEAFDFSYAGYETADNYPPASEEDAFFVMKASEGAKLLLLKFTAKNISDHEEMLDMSKTGMRFKVRVNGETKNALTTMLLNDFASFQESIEAGESKELVVVCEVSKEQAETIETLSLTARHDEAGITISLKN